MRFLAASAFMLVMSGDAAIAAGKTASPVAKEIFGHKSAPAPLAARSIGSYARGCLAGAKPLPIDGSAWQAMRLSRNRNWGHPLLIKYLERLAKTAQKQDEWPGLLVGDLAQPMGGPMLTGHASHQIGLDADIWLNPMPEKTLSRKERETRSAISMLAKDGVSVDKEKWTESHARLIKRAASYDEVARIFVHPAIKKELCEWADKDRDWLSKVRPWWGHHYHFHVRLSCPPSSPGCENQRAIGSGDGCGREVTSWLRKMGRPKVKPKKPPKTKPKPKKPKPQITLADLPQACGDLVGNPPVISDIPIPIRATPISGTPMPDRKPPDPERRASLQR